MLHSALDERGRRFKLALRAGIPILVLFTLIFFTTFSKEAIFKITLDNALLMGGLVFTTIYFIYFLLELDIKETLLDQTTQGYNQESFVRKLQADHPKTLAIVYINNLGTINDNYGTNAANEMLQRLIIKLHDHAKRYSIGETLIGRNMGAEFLVAVNNDNIEVKQMLESFTLENPTINSIEVDYRFAVVVNSSSDPEQTISLLRDQIKSQDYEKQEKATPVKDARELSILESSVMGALNNRSFNFYYRPLENVHDKRVDTYEISIKLRSENGKEILPRDYLPIINRLGLGRAYDRIILERTVDTALLVDDTVNFSFNLSPFSIRDRDFLDSAFAYIEEQGLDPARLIIEIYERKTHHDLGKYLKTLNRIRAKGIRICIDNFGSSNASMEYMKHFNFDMVQFDRDFVTNLDDKNSLSILKSLIDMSKELGLTSVAKWVDNDRQKEKLEELGIDYVQGFGIGKQLDEYTLLETYNKRNDK